PMLPSPPLRATVPSAVTEPTPPPGTGASRPALAAAAAGAGPGNAGSTSMSADEVTRTLASLADLRDRGAITPEEFEAKKSELLARL
ncbi:MAG TPA: SHOCT domain-containing protein, partial [Candidatus Limnocylindrales bacterium]